jgi:D-alanine-D-alanine ligase
VKKIPEKWMGGRVAIENRKLRVGVVFGGRSGEHEVSVMSARSVIDGLDPEKYEVVPVAITRDGQWLAPAAARRALQAGVVEAAVLATVGGGSAPETADESLAICPGRSKGAVMGLPQLDVIFPVIHGTYGEDGTLQGLLEMANVPYVGAGVAGSAVGMDKALMKAIWTAAGLPQPRWTHVFRAQIEADIDAVVEKICKEPGLPCFVKPANLGSSVGISKVRTVEELKAALHLAASFDRKVVVEENIEKPREIELAVLGNDHPEVSLPGEIVHNRDFYDYHGKYFETDGQQTVIPAHIPPEMVAELQRLAIEAYQALDLNGLSRVDFLVSQEGKLYLNEVNTMPGFTPVSMYGQLWKATGLPYSQLLDKLIELGLERFHDRQRNQVKPS